MSRLRLLLVGLAALLSPSVGLGQDAADLARRVADIASIALSEYQLGVQAGRVVSSAEWEEARAFLEEARRSAQSLPASAAGPAVALLDTLLAGVQAREPVERLDPRVVALRAHLSGALQVDLDPLPANPPALARGRELYAARCASCHAQFDPLGFALENFDAVGRWRTTDDGVPIDVSGTFTDGTRFNGPAELRAGLLKRSDAYYLTVTQRLLAYALNRRKNGRVYEYEMPAVRAILDDASRSGYRWSSIIAGIASSAPFVAKEVIP